MAVESKELKAAKDAVISSLAALSKASNDAALATAGFFRTLDAQADTSEDIKQLVSSLSILGASVKSIDEHIPLLAAELSGKKLSTRKKIEKDPNAPKKPLTAFFAYSAEVRDAIRADRAEKGETSLSSVELTQLISQKWNSLSPKAKEDWKKRYYDQLGVYNEALLKYNYEKENGAAPVIAAEVTKAEEPEAIKHEKKKSKKRKSEDDDEREEKRKEKKEKKKEKKEKKKLASASSSQ